MTLKSGFFNSSDNDRIYYAEDFSRFLDGIVYDGVYSTIGNRFHVNAYSGMQISVDTGRAWFDHTWTYNDNLLLLTVPTADTVYRRIDAVVIEVNHTDRENYIKIVKGQPAPIPEKPTLTRSEYIKQYALAYIAVGVNVSSITNANIDFVVGTSETPLCSALALSGIPSGGLTGYVLAKTSAESGAVGWFNIDHLPSDTWYLPQGVTESDVIAAFQFRHAEDEESALKNINANNTYRLTKTDSAVTWSGTNGIFIPNKPSSGLNNSVISNDAVGTVAVKYANASEGSKQIGLIFLNATHYLLAKYYSDVGTIIRWYDPESPDPGIPVYADFKRPVVGAGTAVESEYTNWTSRPAHYLEGNPVYYSAAISESVTGGILSCNFSNNLPVLYSSGTKLSLASARKEYSSADGNQDGETWTTYHAAGIQASTSGPLIGNPNNGVSYGSVNIHAVAFYNRILTDGEIASLHGMMANI